MKKTIKHYGIKSVLLPVILFALLLISASISEAAATFVTDLAEWESVVTNIEVLTTTAENVLLADEVTSMPGPNSKFGAKLTFQAVNTGLSRSFSIESLQAQGATDPSDPLFEGGFTFDDHDGGNPVTDSADALSVGDTDDFEDDDWRLNLLDGATMMAFGVEIRHSRFSPGETITLNLLSNAETVAVLDLSSLPNTGNETYFIGIISDVPFDSIDFNEDGDPIDGDDIAIADFRFGDVGWATEYKSNLGNNRRHRFVDVDIFNFYGTEGEEVTINLDKDPAGRHNGDKATLILMDRIRRVRLYRMDRSALPNEISAVLPATGKYSIIVLEQHRRVRGKSFKGDYILRMESSGNASETLNATRWVE